MIITIIVIIIIIIITRYKSGSEVLESERVKVQHRGGRHALTVKQVNMLEEDEDDNDDDEGDFENYDDDDEAQSVLLSNCQSLAGTR